jgi:signal peptidase I
MNDSAVGELVSATPKATLVADLLRTTGRAEIRAWGVSMLPCIWPGDVLTIQSTETLDINAGDIVALKQNGRWLVHRVRLRSASELITRGDSISKNDPPVPIENVIGKIVSGSRGRKQFVLNNRPSWVQRCQACLLCHFGPLRNLMLNFHRAREARISSEVRSKFKPTTAS